MKKRFGWLGISQAFVILALLWLTLGGLSGQARAPLRFATTHLVTLGNVKAAWDTGRWWSLPELSAADPETDPLLVAGFAHVEYLLVNAVHLVSRGVPAVVTLTWALMLIIGGASASWCLRRLGASAGAAWSGGILFTLSPFALSYNTELFGFMPAFVPFAAFAAVALGMGRTPSISSRDWLIVIAGNALLALNSIYYACFAIVVVLVGTVAGIVRTRSAASLRAGAAVLAALTLAMTVSLWTTSATLDTGTTIATHAARPNESEQYSVKLRGLVTPMPDHWFRPLRKWAAANDRAAFPYSIGRTELGTLGAIGLLGLLVVLFIPRLAGSGDPGEALRGASRLMLAVVLIATTGGFGAALTAQFLPRFTNYALLVPFMAFFTVIAVVLCVDRLVAGRRDLVRLGAWTALLVLGVADHGVAMRRIILIRADVAAEAQSVRDLVFTLEQRLPSGARVAQLPIQPEPKQQLGKHPFDHLKLYVMSRTLQFTFPPTSPEGQRLANDLAGVEPADLVPRLRAAGIAAVVIDTRAYPNEAGRVIEAIQNSLSTTKPDVADNRYVVFDIRDR